MSEAGRARILCAGITPCIQRTLIFERFAPGGVNRAASAAVSTGGKAVNVARVLQRLGGHPLLTGFAGGAHGRCLAALLDRMGIEHDFVRADAETRVCTTVIDESSGAVTELVEEAAVPAREEIDEFERRTAALLPRCEIAVAAGALPPGWPEDIYARLAAAAAAAGVPLIVDTHGRPLIGALAARPLLVKLNRGELAETDGARTESDAELAAAGRRLVRAGAKWVLITRGAQDAWLLNDEERWRFAPPRVKALSAVGSGDAASAGIAHALAHGLSMPEAARVGMACGAANAMTLTPGDVTAAMVDYLLEEVGIEKILKQEEPQGTGSPPAWE